MKTYWLLALGLVGMTSNASAQLVGERVDGTKRICIYSVGPTSDRTREYQTGIGSPCSAYYPSIDPNRPMPPTARLAMRAVRDGRRICTYSHGGRRWSAELPLDALCPLTAGLLERTLSDDSARN